jgi:hypothetical protein
MPSAFEEWVRSAKRGLKRLIVAILLAGWTLGWGVVALIGWATSSAAVLGTSLGAIGLSVLAGGGWRYAVVRQRRALAKRSLKARLDLRGVTLSGEIGALIDLFDLASRDVDVALLDPGFGRALQDSVRATLERARAQLEQLAGEWVSTDADLRKLKAMPSIDPVQARASAALERMKQLEGSAEKIVEDAHRVSKRMGEVRGLIGAGAEDGRRAPLEEAIAELEATASAYREMQSSHLP